MLSSAHFRSRNLSHFSKKSQSIQQVNKQKKIINSSFKRESNSSMSLHAQSYHYRSAIVYDNRNEVKELVHQFNGDQRRQIASLTKIMTCFIALTFIKQNNLIPEDIQCQVSKQAAELKGTTAGLEQGNTLSLWDLLHGLMLPSGNDAAYCIAQNLGKLLKNSKQKICQSGRYPNLSSKKQYKRNKFFKNQIFEQFDPLSTFIKEMNKKAQQLFMLNTKYNNPHGLSDNMSFSTAKDQLLLIQQCLKDKLFCRIVKTKLYFGSVREKGDIWNRQIIWQNTNRLLNQGYQGIKTGSTCTAGYCLASWYSTSTNDLIIIILGSPNKEERDLQTLKLTKINIHKQNKNNNQGIKQNFYNPEQIQI